MLPLGPGALPPQLNDHNDREFINIINELHAFMLDTPNPRKLSEDQRHEINNVISRLQRMQQGPCDYVSLLPDTVKQYLLDFRRHPCPNIVWRQEDNDGVNQDENKLPRSIIFCDQYAVPPLVLEPYLNTRDMINMGLVQKNWSSLASKAVTMPKYLREFNRTFLCSTLKSVIDPYKTHPAAPRTWASLRNEGPPELRYTLTDQILRYAKNIANMSYDELSEDEPMERDEFCRISLQSEIPELGCIIINHMIQKTGSLTPGHCKLLIQENQEGWLIEEILSFHPYTKQARAWKYFALAFKELTDATCIAKRHLIERIPHSGAQADAAIFVSNALRRSGREEEATAFLDLYCPPALRRLRMRMID
jgi:hypothetical protein